MSEECKNIEEKAKVLLKTDPLKAKDEFIKAAECYQKKYKKKNHEKMMNKAASILLDHSKPLEPFEARKFIEEAAQIHESLGQNDVSNKILLSLAEKFVVHANNIEKSYLNLVNAIKYLLAAEELFLEHNEEEQYHECTIQVHNICLMLGIPLARIFSYLQKEPAQNTNEQDK